MLREICREKTCLRPEDVALLERISEQLPLIAELTGGDMFIDCPTPDGLAVVVAQARPASVPSMYQGNIIGQYAFPEKEPAVFHAIEQQVPVRDIKATTQEDNSVRQDVTPIYGPGGRCVAVLVCEKDMEWELRREKKLEYLSQLPAGSGPLLFSQYPGSYQELALREVHHRVKNNLQTVASILNLQARRCEDPATKKILQENVGRVLSIAAVHDILTSSTDGFGEIDSLELLKKLKSSLSFLVPEEEHVHISVTGDHCPLDPDTASAVSLVVSELTVNALKHAFPSPEDGRISLSFCRGTLFHTVTVSDNGVGFDAAKARKDSLGLRLVRATVQEKLHGHLSIHSCGEGSKVTFDFKIK